MNNRVILLLAILALPAFIITSCKKDEGSDDAVDNNTPPVATFTVDPPTGNTNTEFNLDASGCSDQETPDNELLVRWDLNDDGTWESQYSTTKLGKATFDTPGDYTIRMEVKDGGGLTASTTRDISVNIGGNTGPATPSDPSPGDGSVGVNIQADLEWTSTDPNLDPVTFDVYFGTDQAPELESQGQEQNIYDPGALQYGTTYYWKIVAHDDQGHTTEGPVWSFTTGTQAFTCGDNFTDARDGKVYGSVQIGEQCWMSKNLNIGDRIDGSEDMSDNSVIEKYCYEDELANCESYGGLYQWNEMMQYAKKNTQGICPDGWHLPTIEEWQNLEMALGMPQDQATASSGWQGSDEGDQLKSGGSSGFNALMAGNRSTSGIFTLGGLGTAFWSASQSSTYNAKARSLDTDHSGVNHTNYNKEYGQAVRCVKN